MRKTKTGERIFHTQGIANSDEDPPITGKQIIGVIVCKVPILSQIAKLNNNVYTFYFVIFVPMVILIFTEIRRIIKHFTKK